MRKLCLVALFVLMPSAAFAEEPEITLEIPSDEEIAAQEGEVIMVTGSAIERKELTTPAPSRSLAKPIWKPAAWFDRRHSAEHAGSERRREHAVQQRR